MQPRKRDRRFLFGPCSLVAGATGLEPAASDVTGQRSNQLSYAPACVELLKDMDMTFKNILCTFNRTFP